MSLATLDVSWTTFTLDDRVAHQTGAVWLHAQCLVLYAFCLEGDLDHFGPHRFPLVVDSDTSIILLF